MKIYHKKTMQSDCTSQKNSPNVRKWRGLLAGVAVSASLAVASSALAQQLINVQLVDPNGGAPYAGQGALGGAGDTNWNVLLIPAGGNGIYLTSSITGLTNSTGAVTSVGIQAGGAWTSAGHGSAAVFVARRGREIVDRGRRLRRQGHADPPATHPAPPGPAHRA